MWHSTQTGAAPVQYGDSYIPGQQHRPTDTGATTTSAAAAPKPAKRFSIAPDSAPAVTPPNVSHTGGPALKIGLQVCCVIALGWIVFFYPSDEPGAGAGDASVWLITDQPNNKAISMPGNEAAPISVRQITKAMAEDYIGRYSKVAIEEMRQFGIPASISLAQGLVESRAGDSKLSRQNNNHFGIKCFSRRCSKGHCTNFTDDTHKDFFRKFKSPWESWRAHSQMLASGRYTALKKHGKNYKQWAYGLKSLGYATDRTYAEKLIGVIEQFNLSRFDN